MSIFSSWWCICAYVLSRSVVFDFLWPHGLAGQAPLSMGFSRQEYWSGVAMSSSRKSSQPRDWTRISCVFCIGRRVLYHSCHPGSPTHDAHRGINKKVDPNKLEVWASSQVKGNKSSIWLKGLQSYMAKCCLRNGVHIYIRIQVCWTLHPSYQALSILKSGAVCSLMFPTHCLPPLLKSLCFCYKCCSFSSWSFLSHSRFLFH